MFSVKSVKRFFASLDNLDFPRKKIATIIANMINVVVMCLFD